MMINSSLQNVTLAAQSSTVKPGNPVSGSGTVLPETSAANRPEVEVTAVPNTDVENRSQEEAGKKDVNITVEAAEKMAERMNDMIRHMQRDLEFAVDGDSGKTIFKVIHTTTGDVIRQVPSEEALALAEALAEGRASLITEQA